MGGVCGGDWNVCCNCNIEWRRFIEILGGGGGGGVVIVG
jgi:hypothetical protein